MPPPCSTLQSSRGEEEGASLAGGARGATEASWGVGGGFSMEGGKGRVTLVDGWEEKG